MNNKYDKLVRKKASCYHKTNPEEKSEDFLMNNACREVGLYNWGDIDFVVPLRRLLNSCREEGGFNSFGWFYIHSLLTKYLCGRLLIQKYCKQHPKISQERIHKPLFIISLPRTGTTLLQRLLAQDPANRNLLYWEGLSPAPFQLSPQKKLTRIQNAKKFLQIRNAVIPSINSIHSAHVHQPEECFLLLDKSFISPQLHVLFDLPLYYKWLKKKDMGDVYRYYKKQLQLLQFTNPYGAEQRWVLKCPFHLFGIKSLLEVFPDARIVQIHRAPTQSLSSLCSMLTTIRQHLQKKKITAQIGQESVLIWSNMMDKVMQIRQEYAAEHFLDISYKELAEDPVTISLNIYKYFGVTPDEVAEKRMNKWLKENPKNKHGVHTYSSENYGLTKSIIDQHFTEYMSYIHEERIVM